MLANIPATILAGESLSDGIDCSGGRVVRITLPDNYSEHDTPVMTFQTSVDGVNYFDLVNDEGQQITITARRGTAIHVGQQVWTNALGWLKVRSGSKANATDQAADVAIMISITPSTSVVFSGGGAYTGETAPEGVADGSIWWNSADGPSAAKRLYVKYFDGNSSQWVAAEQ
jgi:hypothetical protein